MANLLANKTGWRYGAWDANDGSYNADPSIPPPDSSVWESGVDPEYTTWSVPHDWQTSIGALSGIFSTTIGGYRHPDPEPGDVIEGSFFASSPPDGTVTTQKFYYCAPDGTILETIGGDTLNTEYPFSITPVIGGYLITATPSDSYGYSGISWIVPGEQTTTACAGFPKTYTFTLRVTDSDGNTADSVQTVVVTCTAPEVLLWSVIPNEAE